MWWLDVLIGLLFLTGIYGFVLMVRTMTTRLSSHTDRTAEQMYDQHADSPKKERRLSRRDRGTGGD